MIYTQSFPTHFDPTANPDAIVFAPNVRITILTSRLLRLEFDPEGQYEDRPSQAFWRRRQTVPEFSAHESEGWLEIETTHLYLRYRISEMGFNPETLSVEMKQGGSRWHFGQQDPSNLLGTTRTLDNVDGLVLLEPGLISQSGWALYDDTRSLVFNSNGWMLPRQASTAYKDLYFFGYGRDYNAC